MARLIADLDERLRLARAADLASSNRLLEAEALICKKNGRDASARELDLLARIHVKQGRLDSAKRRWEDALSLVQDRAPTEKCLRILESYAQQLFRRRVRLWWLTIALLVGTLVLCIVVQFVYASSLESDSIR